MAIIDTNISMHQAQVSFNRTEASSAPAVRHTRDAKYADPAQSGPVNEHKSEGVHRALGQRQVINSSLNSAAVSIRTADKTMKTIGKHIGGMKSQLEIIVKHYPPFLTGSPERIKALRSFSAFRREIDALTIPPRDDGAAKIMADPAVFPQAGNQIITTGNSGTGLLRSRQAHTGPAGLNLPVLSDTATDAEIAAAIKSLDASRHTLDRRRAGLSADAENLMPTGRFTDMAAAQLSVDVGKSIAQEPSQGFTGMRPLLLHLA